MVDDSWLKRNCYVLRMDWLEPGGVLCHEVRARRNQRVKMSSTLWLVFRSPALVSALLYEQGYQAVSAQYRVQNSGALSLKGIVRTSEQHALLCPEPKRGSLSCFFTM